MSLVVVRARAAITGRRTSAAIWRTASESAGDAIGKPASMMSTFSPSSARAIESLDATSSENPGACSPSRRVVSKTITRAGVVMVGSCSWALPRSQSDNDYRTITTCYKLHGAMDLSALKTFLAVAHERSFSRAAAKVHRTQPAVSQAVRRLEVELGEQLFDRSSKNGTLTE